MEGVPMYGLSMDQFSVTQRARDAGFRDFHLFGTQMYGKVCMLLGLAVYYHSSMNCAKISTWLEETWKPHLVSSIVSVLPASSSVADSLFQDPGFWQSLSRSVLDFSITICTRYNRPDLAQKLTFQGDIDLSDEEVLRLVSHHMCFDLFFLRQSHRGFIQTVIRDEEHRGLPVVIGEELGNLMLLYHNDFRGERSLDSQGFPFYCEAPKENMWTDYFVVVPPDPKTALEKTREMVTNALQFISVLVSNGVSPPLLQNYQQFKENCLLYEAYSVPSGLHDPDLFAVFHNGAPHPPPLVNVEHSIHDCSVYSRDTMYFSFPDCQHVFHEDCLVAHLQVEPTLLQQTSLGCPDCRQPISLVDLAQLSPDLSTSLTQILEDRLAAASTQPAFESKSPEEVSMSAFHECSHCHHSINFKYSITHQGAESQHIVCLDCLGSQVCPTCGEVISNEQWTWVQQAKTFYEMMRRRGQV